MSKVWSELWPFLLGLAVGLLLIFLLRPIL